MREKVTTKISVTYQVTFTCSKSTMESPEQCVKTDVIEVFLMSLLLAMSGILLVFP